MSKKKAPAQDAQAVVDKAEKKKPAVVVERYTLSPSGRRRPVSEKAARR